jgi:glycosyltransferase involved in cell wall biosynthesis
VNRALVSVVMSNYNDARFLRESLPALLEQSHSSLEVIVVDDGSTDDSVALLRDHSKKDPRLRVLVNPKNMGIVFSQGRAQAEARGEYIYFASADDRVLPGFFEKAVTLMEAHPRAGLCWTDPCSFFDSGGPYYPRHTGITPQPSYVSPEQLADAYRSGRLSAPMHAAPALFRRSSYLAAGGFLSDLRWYSDFFTTLVIAFRTGLCYVPEALTSTRVQRTSYSRTGSGQKDAQRKVLTLLLDLLTSPAYADIAPLIGRSGVLAYFGLPMFRLAGRGPATRTLLERRFLRRGLFFSIKHGARRLAAPRVQRLFFLARDFVKSRASAPPS